MCSIKYMKCPCQAVISTGILTTPPSPSSSPTPFLPLVSMPPIIFLLSQARSQLCEPASRGYYVTGAITQATTNAGLRFRLIQMGSARFVFWEFLICKGKAVGWKRGKWNWSTTPARLRGKAQVLARGQGVEQAQVQKWEVIQIKGWA